MRLISASFTCSPLVSCRVFEYRFWLGALFRGVCSGLCTSLKLECNPHCSGSNMVWDRLLLPINVGEAKYDLDGFNCAEPVTVLEFVQ